jgi:hypothetical protein
MFLHLVLALRLGAKLPTLFQIEESQVLLFTERGVHTLKSSHMQDLSLVEDLGAILEHQGGWCLTDSTLSLIRPPWFVHYMCLPVLQTPPPYRDNLHWAEKYGVLRWFITPFTLWEVLVAYVRLKFHTHFFLNNSWYIASREFTTRQCIPSQLQLVNWFRDLVPSARVALRHAGNRSHYEGQLVTRLALLGQVNLRQFALTLAALNGTAQDDLPHEIFIILPRQSYEIFDIVPTNFLANLLLQQWEGLAEH